MIQKEKEKTKERPELGIGTSTPPRQLVLEREIALFDCLVGIDLGLEPEPIDIEIPRQDDECRLEIGRRVFSPGVRIGWAGRCASSRNIYIGRSKMRNGT